MYRLTREIRSFEFQLRVETGVTETTVDLERVSALLILHR